MADTLQNTINPSAGQVDDTVDPASKQPAPPKDRTVAEIIKAHTDLLNNPKFQAEAPPETKQQIEESRQKAYDLYQDRANKAEWGEVAQTIGRALAQYGAAQEGMRSGQNMGGINFGPGIDFEKRIDRYGKDYERQAAAGKDSAEATRQSWADKEAMRRNSLQEALKPGELELKPAEAREKDAADTVQQNLKDKSALDKVLAEAGYKSQENEKKYGFEAGENAKDRALKEKIANMTTSRELKGQSDRDAREAARQDDKAEQMETRSLQQVLSQKEKEQKVAAGLYSDMIHSGDLGKKSKDKMQATYGKRAGDAGFDLGKVDEIEQSSQKPRSILGIPLGQTTDEESYKAKLRDELINKKADEVQQLRQEIAARLAKRKSGGGDTTMRQVSSPSQTQPVGKQEAPAPQSSGTVRVQYKGKLMDIPAARLNDAVRDGAVQVK